ncbi:MAG: hypothetical protein K8W52_03010 [Deltaproteobacteria bacterium]|nr:hypothetical protein [Deltaproteobacteria bacterium]
MARDLAPARWLIVAALALVAAPAAARISSETPAPESLSAPRELARLDAAAEAGEHWRITTPHGPVHIWRPAGYDEATAAIVVYVHGYFHDVDTTWTEHRLPQQFARAGINALFIACEAPTTEFEPVRWLSLGDLLMTVRRRTGVVLPDGPVVAVAHSGGFRTLEWWLPNRGLDTIVLVDAAYGDVRLFWRWVRASRRHRLIDVGDDTRQATDWLHRWLPETVTVDDFAAGAASALPADAQQARIVYARSTVGHMALVTGGVALPLLLRALWVDPLPDVRWSPLAPLPPREPLAPAAPIAVSAS